MGFQGKFRDLSLVDILQVVQMTQKSGVLDIFDGPRHASIVFRDGNIVDARPPGTGRLTEDLEARGLIPPAAKDAEEGPPGERIGERLVRLGYVTAEKLREVLVSRVESAVYETLSWVNGRFDFEIVEPGTTGPALLALADVLPGVNFNTQQILMDALRVFDERRAGRPAGAQAAGEGSLGSAPVVSALEGPRIVVLGPAAFGERLRIALKPLRAQLVELPTLDLVLAELASETRRPAVVVVDVGKPRKDLRGDIGRILLAAKRVVVLTAGEDPAIAAESVAGGAWAHVSVLPGDPGPALSYLQTLVASRLDVLAAGRVPRAPAPPPPLPSGPLGGFALRISALKERLDALSGEVHTSSVSMKILEFVAERLERGVLFLVRPNDLQGLGAFGHTAEGEPIGPAASGMRLPLEEDSAFRRVLERRETMLCELAQGRAADILYGAIGRPHPRDALLLPLTSLGSPVALIYADNGMTGRPIVELAELEVMTRQAGLVLENALLRRMLAGRAAP